MKIRFLLFAALVLAGCVQATTPPQLAYTPGVPVVIANGHYESAAFSVRVPDGWRVITPAADAPPSVIFVSPDDTALMLISSTPIGEPPRPNVENDVPLQTAVREVDVNGTTVYVFFAAPDVDGQWDTMQPLFEHVIASLDL